MREMKPALSRMIRAPSSEEVRSIQNFMPGFLAKEQIPSSRPQPRITRREITAKESTTISPGTTTAS